MVVGGGATNHQLEKSLRNDDRVVGLDEIGEPDVQLLLDAVHHPLDLETAVGAFVAEAARQRERLAYGHPLLKGVLSGGLHLADDKELRRLEDNDGIAIPQRDVRLRLPGKKLTEVHFDRRR